MCVWQVHKGVKSYGVKFVPKWPLSLAHPNGAWLTLNEAWLADPPGSGTTAKEGMGNVRAKVGAQS